MPVHWQLHQGGGATWLYCPAAHGPGWTPGAWCVTQLLHPNPNWSQVEVPEIPTVSCLCFAVRLFLPHRKAHKSMERRC